MSPAPLHNPADYINRESSWLAFNRRVLEEAEDHRNPLLERVKLLAITASNLDEFFEIRVAGLLQRIEDGHIEPDADGMTPAEQRDLIAHETHEFVAVQNVCWGQHLLPKLADEGIRVLGMDDLDVPARAFLEAYYEREIDPLLTPITVDPAHPFPRVLNKALALAFLLRRRRRNPVYIGVVTVPRALPRLIRLPSEGETAHFVFLADVVQHYAERMYSGYELLSSAAFRLTRNSNLYLEEEESRNLLEAVRTELHHRRQGNAVRLEIAADADPAISERLRINFDLEPWQVYPTLGPVNLSRIMTVYEQVSRPDLKFRSFVPRQLTLSSKSRNLFDEICHRDVLLHHPFDSYDPVVSLIETAADDPRVLSIKQTLYRTSAESPIVAALIDAAAQKEVAVVVEVKARFDEASNIRWARSLEDAGVQVFHGLVGLKTHCKLCLIVRQDEDGVMRRYAHLGTGNYNPDTARFYTDLSLLTIDERMTTAVHDVFRFLTAYAEPEKYEPLLVAPQDLARRTIELIEREAHHARQGRPARIIAKMNGLLDTPLIRTLYAASRAGVEIDLMVRGVCALRPGVKGVSDRIRVRSLVGRFLEHSRIFCFENGGDEEIYLGSADWMPRNLCDRVEVVFPVYQTDLRQRLRNEILDTYLADTEKTRLLQADGSYRRIVPRSARAGFNAQEFLIGLAEGKLNLADRPGPPVPRPVRRKRLAVRASSAKRS